MRSFLKLASSSVLLIAISACAPLAEVRKFAEISSQPEVYRSIVNEHVESTRRMKRYTALDQHANYDKAAAVSQKQVPGLLAIQKVLGDYMTVLGQLAADDLPKTDTAAANLKTQLSSLGGSLKLDAAATKAATNLITLVSRPILDRSRHRALSSIIRKHDKDVQEIIGQMQYTVTVIKGEIANERSVLSGSYVPVVSGASAPSAEQLNAIRFMYDTDKELSDKEKACDNYHAALAKIAAGHAKLAASVDKVDKKALSAVIKTYKDDAKAFYDDAKVLLK